LHQGQTDAAVFGQFGLAITCKYGKPVALASCWQAGDDLAFLKMCAAALNPSIE